MEENKNYTDAERRDYNNEEESSFNFKSILTIFILHWQWFVLSVIICLAGAFVYLKFKNPVYQVSAKMLIKDDETKHRGAGGQMLANISDLGFMSNSNGIDNEVEILKSQILAREAVKDLKLYVSYKLEGTIKDHLLYKNQPLNVDIDPVNLDKMDNEDRPLEAKIIKIRISQDQNGTYTLTAEMTPRPASSNSDAKDISAEAITSSFKKLPASVNTPCGVLTITKNTTDTETNTIPVEMEGRDLLVTIYPPKAIASAYCAALTVEPTSKTTSIALLTITDQNVKRATDFLNRLSVCYNRQANSDKNEIAIKTEEFINSRLEKINAELGSTEGALESYKKRNNLIQLKLDATETLAQTSQYSSKLSEAKSQLKLLDFLREYVDDPKNKYQIIPSNVGLDEQASAVLINQYNNNVLERNRLLRSASEIAPQVVTLTSTLDQLQKSIRTALAQARHSCLIKLQSIESQYALYQNKVTSSPEQERILTQIGREQEVKSGLYLMLLQKREENSISLAATADKGKLIDEPLAAGPVSPKKGIIMMMALFAGIGIPFGIFYLMQMMRFRIEGRNDVENITSLPIIADVPIATGSAENRGGIVVKENSNNMIDEVFRSMRTNISFMLGDNKKVIMFTSSTSGEGKTFNAANLAVSFALLGKKAILIGLDIRLPALGKLFNLSDTKNGISLLLTKDKPSKEEIQSHIVNSGVNKNLDIMLAGPIPPNPTELLAKESLGIIIENLKEMYDYIILDTAPVGLVADTLQIGKYADVTAIICRSDYTPKSAFTQVNQLSKEKKLNNMCVIVNGLDMSKKKYGMYYGYGKYGKYGNYYGRNYGYGANGNYGNYFNSHYGNKDDNTIKK